MPERRAAAHTVATILLLRRVAEREARRQLEAARARLEAARRREELLTERLRAAEQALRAEHARALPQRLLAQQLAERAEAGERRREEACRCAALLADVAAEVPGRIRQVEQAREQLLLAIARREAAELHEATERRERQRHRARRAAALDDELASRRRP